MKSTARRRYKTRRAALSTIPTAQELAGDHEPAATINEASTASIQRKILTPKDFPLDCANGHLSIAWSAGAVRQFTGIAVI